MENNKIFSVLLYLIVCLFLASNVSFSQETAGQLFEKALYLEEGKGELQQAIGLYQQVLKQYPEDRAVSAKAQLHIGICYEKLGKQEARKAYQRVIEEYAEQHDLVAEAKSRLDALEQSIKDVKPKGLIVRKVWEGLDIDACGEISPDGKYLSFVDWHTGDLAIYEIATGKKRRLTNKGSWDESDEFALFSRWSPDGTQIVYDWYNDNDFIELCIIDLDGSKPRILYSDKQVEWAQTYDWSTDGKQILACFSKRDKPDQIVLVSVGDGSVSVLKTLGNYYPENMCFSPDGRYIVYDLKKNENFDISLMSTDGSREITLIEHPAHDLLLGCAPNGKYVIFTSNRTGTPDIWAIEVMDEKTLTTPWLIKSNKGPNASTGLGFATNGSFYYCEHPNRTDVYVMEIDPETGTIVVPPHEAINHFVGSNATPDYSPDGKYLAYVSRRAPLEKPRMGRPTGNVLCIRSLDNGIDREFRPGLNNFGFPRWSPNSRSVMVVNWEDDGESMGHYKVDAKTGEVNLVVMTHKPNTIHAHEWSADGKSVFLVRISMIGDSARISQLIARDIDNSTETELLRGNWKDVYSLGRSPDGRWLAVLGGGEKRNLRIIPAMGGEPRVLHTFNQGDNSWICLGWSADGKYIFVPKYCEPIIENKWDLWRIPMDGGEAQSLGLEMAYFWWISAHPDGRHIAFSNQGSSYELPAVWVMENFLPEIK